MEDKRKPDVVHSQELERRTLEIRAFCQKVGGLMKDGLLDEVRREMAEEIPNLAPILDEKEPVKRMLTLFKGVADIAKVASGHDFDLVINPCSGSDISAGLSFESNNLVTIDEGNLFAIHDNSDEGLRNRLKRILRGKLVTGMHGFLSNQGLVAYAMELVINGVDPNSLNVLEEEKVGNMTMTVLEFSKDSRIITHTNFARYNLKKNFDLSRVEDNFLQRRVKAIVDASKHVVLLSKAGGGSVVDPNIATTSFYSMLPDGAVVISDANERPSLIASDASASLSSLVTERIRSDMNNLQGGERPNITNVDGWTDKHIVYGYATDLRDLQILEVRK